MKAVLISIQPYWAFLIIAKTMGWNIGKEKTVEVRKNYPKDEKWDNVAKIYCSKDKRSFSKIPQEYQPFMERLLGKVMGEFVCDKIENIEIRHFTVLGHKNRYAAVGENPDHQWLKKSCLSYDEVAHYGKMAPLCGWHISNLVIYDEPKELTEFWSADKCPYASEDGCTYEYHCFRAGQTKRCGSTLQRPPQSWCYVEVTDNANL